VIAEALSAAAGAFLAILTGMAIEWWKSERQDFGTLCDGFCELIAAAADAGAEFWLTLPGEKSLVLYARLAGFQQRMAGYNILLVGRATADMQDDIEASLSALFKSLTGGDPQDPKRVPSMKRAMEIQDGASAAILAVRQAAFERLSFNNTVDRFIRWRYRQTTMAPAPEHPFADE
jgi:hypothetical protein